MPTFFIILIFTYLGGNAYIFYRGLQTLSGFPYGIKILLKFWKVLVYALYKGLWENYSFFR